MSEISGKKINPYIFDMRGFLQILENEGDLVRIQKEMEGGDEIASVMWELEERKGNHGPAVVFDKIRGFEVPVVKNLFGSLRRWALILGFPNWRKIKIRELKDFLFQRVEAEREWIPPRLPGPRPAKKWSSGIIRILPNSRSSDGTRPTGGRTSPFRAWS